ncbi:MAG: TetR/AcrR family transcriptional regulator [Candidatus Enteromonas sp.]
MRNEYSNAKRSKEQLRQGLMDLLEDGVPFNGITITKLCETSGVNRGTFYNHYRNMKDLAMAIAKEYFGRLEKACEEIGFETHELRVRFFETVSEAIERNKKVTLALSQSMPENFRLGLEDTITKINLRHFEDAFYPENEEQRTELKIVASGIACIYARIIFRKDSLSREEAAKASVALLDRLDPNYSQR